MFGKCTIIFIVGSILNCNIKLTNLFIVTLNYEQKFDVQWGQDCLIIWINEFWSNFCMPNYIFFMKCFLCFGLLLYDSLRSLVFGNFFALFYLFSCSLINRSVNFIIFIFLLYLLIIEGFQKKSFMKFMYTQMYYKTELQHFESF